jgi:hypothetical protein
VRRIVFADINAIALKNAEAAILLAALLGLEPYEDQRGRRS